MCSASDNCQESPASKDDHQREEGMSAVRYPVHESCRVLPPLLGFLKPKSYQEGHHLDNPRRTEKASGDETLATLQGGKGDLRHPLAGQVE